MKLSKTSGAVLAATAAAFILSGPVLTTSVSYTHLTLPTKRIV